MNITVEGILTIAFIIAVAAFALLWDEVWKDKPNS